MDGYDENLSDHESVHCNDDSDYELNSEDANIHVGGNGNGPSFPEDEIDDETLFKCFKILRCVRVVLIWSFLF
uniref:Uncharacterized protein n=1 Tax=Arundo donax TaxID=35708 RepID=A0A0A9CZD2_ARUDO